MQKVNEKKVVISQPRYLPALNYLQRLYFADLFIFLDDVQRQPRDYENRNIVFSHGKKKWLTVPVSSSSRELINKSVIDGSKWIKTHKDIIHQAYRKHPFYSSEITETYYHNAETVLTETGYNMSDLFIHLTINLCGIFGFKPKLLKSSSLTGAENIKGPKKLMEICRSVRAGIYISGPNGRNYGVNEAFAGSDIKILYHDYSYPEYCQYGHSEFVPWLPFFDPVFNLGLEKNRQLITRKPDLCYE